MLSRAPERARAGRSIVSRWLWTLPGVIAAAVGVLATHGNLWSLSGVQILTEGYFEDLRQVTATAGCVQRDPAWNLLSASCDPWLRPYNYPSVWARAFAALGLDLPRTSLVGYALILLFAASICVLSFWTVRGRAPARRVALLCVCAVSPPALFAMERGNIDIVVFAVTVAAIVSAAAGLLAAAALLVAMAATLKLFPLGAAPLALLGPRRLEPLLVACLGLGAGAVLLLPELPIISAGTPQTTYQSFGVAVLPMAVLGVSIATPDITAVARPIGFAVFLLVAAVLVVLRARSRRRPVQVHARLAEAVAADRFTAAAIVGGGGALLVAHLVGTSWDYRLIFAIPVIAGLLRVASERIRWAGWLAGLFTLQLFLTYRFSGPTPLRVGVEPWLSAIWVISVPYLTVLIGEVVLLRVRLRTRGTPTDAVLRRPHHAA